MSGVASALLCCCGTDECTCAQTAFSVLWPGTIKFALNLSTFPPSYFPFDNFIDQPNVLVFKQPPSAGLVPCYWRGMLEYSLPYPAGMQSNLLVRIVIGLYYSPGNDKGQAFFDEFEQDGTLYFSGFTPDFQPNGWTHLFDNSGGTRISDATSEPCPPSGQYSGSGLPMTLAPAGGEHLSPFPLPPPDSTLPLEMFVS